MKRYILISQIYCVIYFQKTLDSCKGCPVLSGQADERTGGLVKWQDGNLLITNCELPQTLYPRAKAQGNSFSS